ncbi:hypothetical protein HRI_004629800 [Hibiscus trionum]|uniref:Endonuclease/exonuclease/phosphatase domain-containing protein n=1 Tax=Hibiscus trionum TaxID=183268 RepID=A0A9W7J6L5_HIBTR|nr:hypothetical protein HRI_004629800 [Hibiscus trionum]
MNKSMLITWNIRGLCRWEKKVVVRKLVTRTKSKIVFLQETKLRSVEVKTISQLCGRRCNFEFKFSASVGAAGGLISCWDSSFFSNERCVIEQNFIGLIGKYAGSDLKCALINVYGPNVASERRVFFDRLATLISKIELPVLIGGDFNIVRNAEEKIGASFNKKSMAVFSEFIEGLTLIDPPLRGSFHLVELQGSTIIQQTG